jgi:hypothetical protein
VALKAALRPFKADNNTAECAELATHVASLDFEIVSRLCGCLLRHMQGSACRASNPHEMALRWRDCVLLRIVCALIPRALTLDALKP